MWKKHIESFAKALLINVRRLRTRRDSQLHLHFVRMAGMLGRGHDERARAPRLPHGRHELVCPSLVPDSSTDF
eukprot:5952430-Alexandrium_andersonii.AAC.1